MSWSKAKERNAARKQRYNSVPLFIFEPSLVIFPVIVIVVVISGLLIYFKEPILSAVSSLWQLIQAFLQ